MTTTDAEVAAIDAAVAATDALVVAVAGWDPSLQPDGTFSAAG